MSSGTENIYNNKAGLNPIKDEMANSSAEEKEFYVTGLKLKHQIRNDHPACNIPLSYFWNKAKSRIGNPGYDPKIFLLDEWEKIAAF